MKTILTLIAFILLSNICHAQQMVPKDIPTPNACSLGKFGDIPVSYYTGLPNISITLYKMNVRGFEFPITLQHDASGVMVNSLPAWTGHNWTLNASGVITRKKNGFCDEFVPTTQFAGRPFTNYFNSCGKLKEHLAINDPEVSDDSLRNTADKIRYDYQPDIFHFSFLGKSGKFFMGNDGEWKVYSDENLDIVFDVYDSENYIRPFIEAFPEHSSIKQPKVIKGFIIRDDKGYIYEFGGNNSSIDYMMNFYNQKNDYFIATSWYLTKIKDKYENILYELEYERGAFIPQFYNYLEATYLYEHSDDLGGYGQEYFSSGNTTFPYNAVLNSPVYLSRIKTLHWLTIDFTSEYSSITMQEMYPNLDVLRPYDDAPNGKYGEQYLYYLQTSDNDSIAKYQYPCTEAEKTYNPLSAARLKVLKSINIGRTGSPLTLKTIGFTYSYDSRMHLTDVRFLNGHGSNSIGRYSFHYKNYDLLPTDYLSTEADHWGYYNASAYGTDLTNIQIKRQPNTTTMQYGLLSEIIYPTGGKSVFTYEPHDYSAYVSNELDSMTIASGIASGVRIKSIAEYSDSENTELLRKREFSYIKPSTSTSSGELFAMPRYHWSNWSANLLVGNDAESVISISRTSSIMPLSNSFGPHIGYSIVEEKEIDGTYIRYKYINISEAMDERFFKDFSDGNPSPYDMFTERGYKRGKLLSIEQFDNSNTLIHKTNYSYTKNNVETDSVLTSNIQSVNYGSSMTFGYYTGGVYKLLFPKFDIIADTTITYRGENDSVIDCREYEKENCLVSVTYKYPHTTLVRILNSTKHSRCNNSYYDEYDYPFSSTDVAIFKKFHHQFDLQPTTTKRYVNDALLNGNTYNYRMSDTGSPVIDSFMRINSNGSKDTIVWYQRYTPTYAIDTYRKLGEPKTRMVWATNDCLPYLIIRGVDEAQPIVNEYDFDAYYGLTCEYFPNGYEKHYKYDVYGRLYEIAENIYYPLQLFRYNNKNK